MSRLAAPAYVGAERSLRKTSTPLMQRVHSTRPSTTTAKRSCVPPSVKSSSPTRQVLLAPLRGERRERVAVDALEEVELLEHLDHTAAARYSCTKCTAIEPSPTAEATRFIDSLRTSPATNTPGMLVSSR